ncbi:MAG: hypothetical protein AAGI44_02505 [Pseudomonadota bacterium]
MDSLKLISEVCMRQKWQLDGNQITVSITGGRKQFVRAEVFLYEGQEMIRLVTLVGPMSKLSDTQRSALLSRNSSLAFGALTALGDDLAMTETLLTHDAGHEQLSLAVRFLAETCDGYEEQIYGTDQY